MLSPFEVVAEPNRRRIIDLLADGRQSVNYLVRELDLSQPAVSKHLRIMKDAQFVEFEYAGRQRLYNLKPEPLYQIFSWLEPYRKYWDNRLDRLELHLDLMGHRPGKRRRKKS